MHLVFSLSKFSPLVDIVFRWEGGRLRRGRRGKGREKETANKDKAGSVQCPVHHFPYNPTPSPLQCRLLLCKTHVPVGKICQNVEKNVPSLPTKLKYSRNHHSFGGNDSAFWFTFQRLPTSDPQSPWVDLWEQHWVRSISKKRISKLGKTTNCTSQE